MVGEGPLIYLFWGLIWNYILGYWALKDPSSTLTFGAYQDPKEGRFRALEGPVGPVLEGNNAGVPAVLFHVLNTAMLTFASNMPQHGNGHSSGLYGSFQKSECLVQTRNTRALTTRTPTKRTPHFRETAIWFSEGSALNLPYINPKPL